RQPDRHRRRGGADAGRPCPRPDRSVHAFPDRAGYPSGAGDAGGDDDASAAQERAMKEFGVFLPIANGGWIVSKATPPLDGGWEQNRDAALIAEEQGFDFVMAMGKWRGFGGETGHWGRSLEA